MVEAEVQCQRLLESIAKQCRSLIKDTDPADPRKGKHMSAECFVVLCTQYEIDKYELLLLLLLLSNLTTNYDSTQTLTKLLLLPVGYAFQRVWLPRMTAKWFCHPILPRAFAKHFCYLNLPR